LFLEKNKFFCFVCYRSETYYALFFGCFDMKLLPDFLIVSIEMWLRFEQKTCNNFFIHHCRTKRKVGVCMKLFIFCLTEYLSIWPKICHVLFQILLRFLHGISAKKKLEIFFRNSVHSKALLFSNLWNFVVPFYSVSIGWKNSKRFS